MECLAKLIVKDGVFFTSYRYKKNDYEKHKTKIMGIEPTRQNSRYVYFEIEGDLLNK